METPYRRIPLEQGSPNWHRWRNTGVGGSDAPVIMGENPFKRLDQLVAEKRAPAGGGFMNEAMARGVALEPAARAAYCARIEKTVEPACLQSVQHDWMRVSVDGISECGGHVVEIKCGVSVYRKTAMSGIPPRYYYGQLQHALAVTGLDVLDFWCYLPNTRPLHVPIKRNAEYIKRLFEEEFRFWETHIKDLANS